MHIRILFLLLITSLSAVASSTDSLRSYDRMMLSKLLKQRVDQFGNYTESLEKTSGIFGGKTKKDWKESAQVLTRIVRLDNQMISILNRQLSYRSFEKTSFSYESLQAIEKQQALQTELEFTQRNLKAAQAENARLRELTVTHNRLLTIFIVCLAVIAAFMFWLLRRREWKPARA